MKNKPQDGKSIKSKDAAKEAKDPVLDPDLIRNLTTPNVWSQPPVDMQPRKLVSSWAVYRAAPRGGKSSELFELHFVGRDLTDGGGCVSSRIMSFDPKTMCGTTRSGRIYQLAGFPGVDLDAEYVLNHWLEFNDVDVEEVTEEFMKTHGLTQEEIANRERSRLR